MKVLTIGMPVFNGLPYIEKAIQSIQNQSHKDWRLIISDNASSDGTVELVESFCKSDGRIILIKNHLNSGATTNFLRLTREANSKYFMWAAADDEWSASYLSACISFLDNNKNVSFVGGIIENTDSYGSLIRRYDSFSGYEDDKPWKRIYKYLSSKEADGKANMIYSIYRSNLINDIASIDGIFEGWGSDMAFVLAALSRANYHQVKNITHYKRICKESEVYYARMLWEKRYSEVQFEGNFPPDYFNSYLGALIRGMPTASLRTLTYLLMHYRRTIIDVKKYKDRINLRGTKT